MSLTNIQNNKWVTNSSRSEVRKFNPHRTSILPTKIFQFLIFNFFFLLSIVHFLCSIFLFPVFNVLCSMFYVSIVCCLFALMRFSVGLNLRGWFWQGSHQLWLISECVPFRFFKTAFQCQQFLCSATFMISYLYFSYACNAGFPKDQNLNVRSWKVSHPSNNNGVRSTNVPWMFDRSERQNTLQNFKGRKFEKSVTHVVCRHVFFCSRWHSLNAVLEGAYTSENIRCRWIHIRRNCMCCSTVFRTVSACWCRGILC